MLQDLIAGFDQEAAAAIMARLVSFKMENEVNIQFLNPECLFYGFGLYG